jgi:hypothetical protein
MANSIGWGRGADNNAIGWGQGAINNIGWGYSQYVSYSGETDITGDYAFIDTFITSFSSRITTDSGTFEASSCLYNSLFGEISQGGIYENAFNNRVLTDSGVMEADNCLINFVNSLT